MAVGTATCRCAKCGSEFKKSKDCKNRAEADNYVVWATDHYTECTECYKKRIEAENKSRAESGCFNLPEIKGVSDKQIAYAERLRAKHFANYVVGTMAYEDFITITDEEYETCAKENNMSVDELREMTIVDFFEEKTLKLLKESNASAIIDLCK